MRPAVPVPAARQRDERRSSSFAGLAARIVDLSADFRLRDADDYERWYGKPHANPAWLAKFVYGLPELHRAEIAGAQLCQRRRLQCHRHQPGDLAAVCRTSWWTRAAASICEVKVGSSEGGNASSDSTHHPERAGVMRSFAPTGHRHTAEILQALAQRGRRTAGAPERHGGGQRARRAGDGARLRQAGRRREGTVKAYREAYRNEPFVRIVKERTGLYRYPEPKILSGSNYADVGFEYRPGDRARRRALRDRQPDEGRRRHGGAVHERDAGLGRDGGARLPGSAPDLDTGSMCRQIQNPFSAHAFVRLSLGNE